ncbi:hypothetical protein, partial [Micromonospora chokoriensis]
PALTGVLPKIFNRDNVDQKRLKELVDLMKLLPYRTACRGNNFMIDRETGPGGRRGAVGGLVGLGWGMCCRTSLPRSRHRPAYSRRGVRTTRTVGCSARFRIDGRRLRAYSAVMRKGGQHG